MEHSDHLWMRLQHLDERGSALLDINWDPTDPIREARESFATTLMQPVKQGPLRVPFRHFEPHGSEVLGKMVSFARKFTVSVDAQVNLDGMGPGWGGQGDR